MAAEWPKSIVAKSQFNPVKKMSDYATARGVRLSPLWDGVPGKLSSPARRQRSASEGLQPGDGNLADSHSVIHHDKYRPATTSFAVRHLGERCLIYLSYVVRPEWKEAGSARCSGGVGVFEMYRRTGVARARTIWGEWRCS